MGFTGSRFVESLDTPRPPIYVYEVVEKDYEVDSRFLTTLDIVKAHTLYVKMRAAYIANRLKDGNGCGMYSRDLIWACPYELEQIELDKWSHDCIYEQRLMDDYDKGDKRKCRPSPNPPPPLRDPNATPMGLFSGVYKMNTEVEQFEEATKLLDNLDNTSNKLKAKKDWI